MKVYDNYEISPCTRTEEPDSPGKFYYQVCTAREADVWTLYGHIESEGVEAIGDFSTREAAEKVYFRITGARFTGSYKAQDRLRVMHSGPRLLEALISCANLLAAYDESEGEEGYAWREAIASIAEANGHDPLGAKEPTGIKKPVKSNGPIIIEVLAGVVQDVRNVPPGIRYEIIDHDDLEAQEDSREKDGPPLPPDPEGMNDARASWAAKAIATFQEATGADEADALCDLLADMMHWSDRKKHDFDRAFLRAQDHYHAERLPVNDDEAVRKKPAKKEKRHVG